MLVRTTVLTSLLALAWAHTGSALVQYQALDQMHHTSWSAADGLDGEPLRLAQTIDGFLWIGTNNGLYRFDGMRFERFKPDSGALPAVGISALTAAPDGGLWVGYLNGGVSRLTAEGAITSYNVADSIPLGNVRSIVVTHDGAVWVAAVGGVSRLESGRWRRIRMDWNLSCKSAWTLFVERDGTLWVGGASPDRMLYLPPGSRKFVDIGADHSALQFIRVDDSTIGYSHNIEEEVRFLHRTPIGAAEFQTVKEIPAFAITLDAQGGLWFAGYDIARRRLSQDSTTRSTRFIVGPIERVKRSGEMITGLSRAVLVDREGSVWAGTARGLDRFRRRNVAWTQDTLIQFGATFVADQQGEIWLLSPGGGGIRRLRDGYLPPGGPALPRLGMLDSQGAVWVAQSNGVARWKDGVFTPVPPPQVVVDRKFRFTVLAMAEDRTRRVWASVGGVGLFYYKDQTWTFVPVLSNRNDWSPIAIAVDQEDRVWLAYPEEVAVLHNGKVQIFSKEQGLNVGPILGLATRDRHVWVGGELGLALYNGARFQTVHVADGPSLRSASDLIPTVDGLWLTAGNSIMHIPGPEVAALSEDSSHRVRRELFDLESDLPDGITLYRLGPRAIQGRDGILRFLTHQGIASIDPRRIDHNPLPPNVIIRGVTADDHDYSPHASAGEVELPPLTRTLRFDYTASSLAIPGRVKFRHRLEGWDDQWQDAGTRREVFYTNLGPGRYSLRVIASNNDGIWSDTGATLRFRVLPAWFQTAWFKIVVVLSVLAGIFYAYRSKVRRVAMALSARFDERLAERTRIARDLHDTLLQTVQASRIVAQNALASEDPQRMRQGMERLTDWLGKAVTEGRGAVQTLRDSVSASHQLEEALATAADTVGRPADLTVSVAVHGEPHELEPLAGDEIYRIGCEAIRNACAHSGATQLEITVEYAQDLTLCIGDNGHGISPGIADEGKPGHFGLHGMRERAKTIGGTLTITGDSRGTTILLLVPGRKAFGPRRIARNSAVLSREASR